MTATAYYNEIDPFAAAWLRNLIAAGHIAPGIVDERSIEDVRPDELAGYAQCHFFAGIGVWSYALRQAGWPDNRPVWTGSCPCQPFSQAGQGFGFTDERHLWPAFFHLIRQWRPAIIFGEQVASKNTDPWIDLVCADMEALGYPFAATPFPAAGIGSPNIRDRNYWVAYADNAGLERWGGVPQCANQRTAGPNGLAKRVADLHYNGCEARGTIRPVCQESDPEHGGAASGLGYADCDPAGRDAGSICGAQTGKGRRGRYHYALPSGASLPDAQPQASPTNGFWRDADWLFCRDGKWRPVEPGTFPLAHGAPARVGRLRGYGNAINAKAAQTFIEAVMEAA